MANHVSSTRGALHFPFSQSTLKQSHHLRLPPLTLASFPNLSVPGVPSYLLNHREMTSLSQKTSTLAPENVAKNLR